MTQSCPLRHSCRRKSLELTLRDDVDWQMNRQWLLQVVALQRWRAYVTHRRRKARMCRTACALTLRHARRRLQRHLGAWRRWAASQAHRRAARRAALQRTIRARLRRWVFGWRLAALRQARSTCRPLHSLRLSLRKHCKLAGMWQGAEEHHGSLRM